VKIQGVFCGGEKGADASLELAAGVLALACAAVQGDGWDILEQCRGLLCRKTERLTKMGANGKTSFALREGGDRGSKRLGLEGKQKAKAGLGAVDVAKRGLKW